jgi:hypothetical protein
VLVDALDMLGDAEAETFVGFRHEVRDVDASGAGRGKLPGCR